jgi:hypothetical protein
MKTREDDFCEEEKKEGTFPEEKEREHSFDRRSLARSLAASAAAALLPAAARADDVPSSLSKESPGSPVDAAIEAALAVTPVELSPEQRLDVRNGVRSLEKALEDARKAKLDYDVEPAFVFLPEGRR